MPWLTGRQLGNRRRVQPAPADHRPARQCHRAPQDALGGDVPTTDCSFLVHAAGCSALDRVSQHERPIEFPLSPFCFCCCKRHLISLSFTLWEPLVVRPLFSTCGFFVFLSVCCTRLCACARECALIFASVRPPHPLNVPSAGLRRGGRSDPPEGRVRGQVEATRGNGEAGRE